MTETENRNDYKNGLKFTSFFGGVQFFQILFSVIRSKFVAVLLGPAGMGMLGLLSSTIQLIFSATELGLSKTAVRDISIAYNEHNEEHFSWKVSVFRRIIWLTGIGGMLLCLLLSPLWSKLTFGNYNYTLAFIVLSCVLLANQLTNGNTVLMQGTKHLKQLGKASIYGSLAGLLISVPLYLIWGMKGIVPALLLTSLATLITSIWFSRKIQYQKIPVSNRIAIKEGAQMLRLGIFVTLQTFFSMLAAYIIRIYIGHTGSIEDVGLFNSGFLIVDSAVSLVYASIAYEYYPRLSACASDTKPFNHAINQQIHISLVLLGPILALFLLFGKIALVVLYSSTFTGATLMMQLAMFGAFLRGPAMCFGYTFLAKGDTKAFWLNEFTSKGFELVVLLICYTYWGLTGLGIAYLLSHVQYLIQSGLICKYRYQYTFDRSLLRVFIPQLLIGVAIFTVVYTMSDLYRYPIGILLLIMSVSLVYKALREKLKDIKK